MKRLVTYAIVLVAVLSLSMVSVADASRMGPGPSKGPNTGKSFIGSEACKKCHAQQYTD